MKKAIFTCANRGWLDQGRVTIQSIVENAKDADVFLFTTGFNKVDLDTVKMPGATIVKVDIELEGKIDTYIPEDSMYQRLAAAKYLVEAGYDVAAYMDADAIMIRPFPDDFWVQKNGMVIDCLSKTFNGMEFNPDRLRDGYVKKQLWDEDKSFYFNSGFMRMDLHDPKWLTVYDFAIEYRARPDLPSMALDQDVLNLHFKGRFEWLHLGYNFALWHEGSCDKKDNWNKKCKYNKDEYFSVLDSVANSEQCFVIHYAATGKPWYNINMDRLASILSIPYVWGKIALRTPDLSEEKLEVARKNIAKLEHLTANVTKHEVEFPTMCKMAAIKENKTIGLSELFDI